MITKMHISFNLATIFISFAILLLMPSHVSGSDNLIFSTMSKTDYIDLIDNSDILASSGYIVYRDYIENGKITLIEIFGDGTVILIEYLDNVYIYDDLKARGLDWETAQPGNILYQDYTGREIGEYLRCYIINDSEFTAKAFMDIAETELFEYDRMYGFFSTAEIQYVAVYVDGLWRRINWGKVDLFQEEEYPNLRYRMVDLIDQVRANGEIMNVYDVLAIKGDYNKNYHSNRNSSPGFLEAYLKLKEAKGEKIE